MDWQCRGWTRLLLSVRMTRYVDDYTNNDHYTRLVSHQDGQLPFQLLAFAAARLFGAAAAYISAGLRDGRHIGQSRD